MDCFGYCLAMTKGVVCSTLNDEESVIITQKIHCNDRFAASLKNSVFIESKNLKIDLF